MRRSAATASFLAYLVRRPPGEQRQLVLRRAGRRRHDTGRGPCCMRPRPTSSAAANGARHPGTSLCARDLLLQRINSRGIEFRRARGARQEAARRGYRRCTGQRAPGVVAFRCLQTRMRSIGSRAPGFPAWSRDARGANSAHPSLRTCADLLEARCGRISWRCCSARAARRLSSTMRCPELREAADFCRYYAAEATSRRRERGNARARPDRREQRRCSLRGRGALPGNLALEFSARDLSSVRSRRRRWRATATSPAGRADALIARPKP